MGILDDIVGGVTGAVSQVGSGARNIVRGITGQTGAEAAYRSGQLQAGAITRASELESAAAEQALQQLTEQLGITREQFAPFVEAGLGAFPALQEAIASQQGGARLPELPRSFEETLSQAISGGGFEKLLEQRQRGVQGQLAAGGLTRSGTAITEAARIPTDVALDLESRIAGREQAQFAGGLAREGMRFGQGQTNIENLQRLFSGGQAAAAGEAGQTGNITQSIINAITGGARAQGQGITGAAGATASGILGAGQSQSQGIQNLLNLAVTAYAASDPRLKENVRNLGKIGELDLVEWDWIPELGEDFFKDSIRMGFMSTQVREYYPQYVHELGGYDVINYTGLNKQLEQEGKKWSTLQ